MGEKLVLQIDKQLEEIERSSSTAQSLFHRVAGKSASVEQVLGLADCIASMRRALTPEIVSKFKELQGSPIGFVTDKDKDGGYDDVVLRDVMLEAILRGFAPINNEFNVIAGRFYPAKNGLERKVREFPGLSDLKITLGVPNNVGEGALVAATATWKMNGAEQRLECLKTEALDARIPVRINKSMGVDAILGKAERKLYAKIYSRLFGVDLSEPDQSLIPDVDDAASQETAVEIAKRDYVQKLTSSEPF